MKKLDGSLSRLIAGFALLFLAFSISNSCTKSDYGERGNETTQYPSGNQVIVGSSFIPVEIKISAGEMVIWTNNSAEAQSVTSDDGLMDGIISSGGTYSFKFTSAGTYAYHSRIHPTMTGKVVVK